jgi:hypothetical protein
MRRSRRWPSGFVRNSESFGDSNVTTPSTQAISHISFCYDADVVGRLDVVKFYDANANGINDDGQPIAGWAIDIQPDGLTLFTPISIMVAPGPRTVTEYTPIQPNWVHTTPTSVNVNVPAGGTASDEFGNLCLGGGGGMTRGFWQNKNGQALFGADDLALMVALNLRDQAGAHVNPGSYAAFKDWLKNANAQNMAYQLSAQLAAMALNVNNGKVDGNALIYAPGTTSANALGFATVNAVIAEANAELGLHGLTTDGSPFRDYQEALKDALDNANNNETFVQATPCPFPFNLPV